MFPLPTGPPDLLPSAGSPLNGGHVAKSGSGNTSVPSGDILVVLGECAGVEERGRK